MKFKLQLVCELAENEAISTEDVFAFEKEFDSFERVHQKVWGKVFLMYLIKKLSGSIGDPKMIP